MGLCGLRPHNLLIDYNPVLSTETTGPHCESLAMLSYFELPFQAPSHDHNLFFRFLECILQHFGLNKTHPPPPPPLTPTKVGRNNESALWLSLVIVITFHYCKFPWHKRYYSTIESMFILLLASINYFHFAPSALSYPARNRGTKFDKNNWWSTERYILRKTYTSKFLWKTVKNLSKITIQIK